MIYGHYRTNTETFPVMSSSILHPNWFIYWNWHGPNILNEPRHDKTNKVTVRPAKTQISLSIRPVWSESSLSAWRKLVSLATHWAHSEDSDQTERMPMLIWVFAGRTVILLVLSCSGSNSYFWSSFCFNMFIFFTSLSLQSHIL